VTTPHHTNEQIRQGRRTVRCHRHSVWMAACSYCREAHAPLLANPSKRQKAGG
jgi:hypothetical protein